MGDMADDAFEHVLDPWGDTLDLDGDYMMDHTYSYQPSRRLNTMARKTKSFVSEKINLPEGTLSWPVLFEPEIKPAEKGRPERKIYRCDIIFEGEQHDELEAARDLAWKAGEAEWGSDDSKWPEFKTRVIRETAEKKPNPQTGKAWEGYEPGKYFISCQSSFKPPIIDQSGREIIDPDELYGGCKVIACVNAYTYEYMGYGTKFGLVAILKVGEGKKFGGERPDASQLFKPFLKTVQPVVSGGAMRAGGGRRAL